MTITLKRPANSYDESLDLEAMAYTPRFVASIMDIFGAYLGGNIIEIGAGVGTMSAHLRSLAKHLDLVEPSIQLSERLRHRFGRDDNVQVINATAEAYFHNIGQAAYNAAAMINFLEHVEGDIDLLTSILPQLCGGGILSSTFWRCRHSMPSSIE